MQNKEIYALGIGHNTPVAIDLAKSNGYTIKALYHYCEGRTGEIDHGYKILGTFADLFKQDIKGKNFLLTMGDNEIRARLTKEIIDRGGFVPTIIHPTAIISEFAKISPIGVYISAYSHVQADSNIGEGTVILCGSNVSHTTTVGKFCFISEGAIVGAYTTVEDFVFFGQGALSISGKVDRIGNHSYIGARALLTKSIPPHTKVAGMPARPIS